jgi:hypothetical protein
MDPEPMSRFEVVVTEGAPRGDLFELEQTTVYQVIDRLSGAVVLAFKSTLEASLSTDTGLWDDYQVSGVAEVGIAPDEAAAIVTYHDGRVEIVPLPPPEVATRPPE